MKPFRIFAFLLHFIVGVFGLMGGYAAFSTPEGPFGIPTSVLKHGPFTDFFIPGLTLFIVIGLGHLVTGFLVARKIRHYPFTEGVMAAVTLGWIIIQCWVMEDVNGLHVAIFVIGLVQGFHALLVILKEKAFPYDILVGFLPGRKQV
jgi:hypothetical protein